MGERDRRILLIGDFQLTNVERTREIEKSALEHHSNDCCTQDPLMDAKVS